MLFLLVIVVTTKNTTISKTSNPNHFKITCSGAGLGLFQFIVPEERIPDSLEGKIVEANFKLYIGRDFSVKFGFDGLDGYSG